MHERDDGSVFVDVAKEQAREDEDDHGDCLQAKLDARRQAAHIVVSHHGGNEERCRKKPSIYERFMEAAGPIDQQGSEEKGKEDGNPTQPRNWHSMDSAFAWLI